MKWHEMQDDDLVALGPDQLGLMILETFAGSGDVNLNSTLRGQEQHQGRQAAALVAIAEAWAWLRRLGFVCPHAFQTDSGLEHVTRLGRAVATDPKQRTAALAAARLDVDVHPLIAATARRQFLLGEYELAVFASLKRVEIRVRSLAGLTDNDYGTDLMNRAFGPNGALTDPTTLKGEQEAVRQFFYGTYGVLRNPAGHRDVNYDDVNEASEAILTASLLMRILDRIERRLAP